MEAYFLISIIFLTIVRFLLKIRGFLQNIIRLRRFWRLLNIPIFLFYIIFYHPRKCLKLIINLSLYLLFLRLKINLSRNLIKTYMSFHLLVLTSTRSVAGEVYTSVRHVVYCCRLGFSQVLSNKRCLRTDLRLISKGKARYRLLSSICSYKACPHFLSYCCITLASFYTIFLKLFFFRKNFFCLKLLIFNFLN